MTKWIAAAIGCWWCVAASAAGITAFPSKSIVIVVPYAAGGPTDTVARRLAVELTQSLGQSVEVRNEPGNGGTRAPTELARAPGDGYTLLLHHIGMATAPTLFRQLSYDPVHDFQPIGLVVESPMVLLTRPQLAFGSPRELIAHIRAHQSTLSIAYAGVGAASHLCDLLLNTLLKVDLIAVPYQGSGPALAHVEKGGADLLCDQTTASLQSIREGKVRPYFVTTPRRLEMLPEVPTAAESGLPELRLSVWHGLYAPGGVPPDVVAVLARALQDAVSSPRFVGAMNQVGVLTVPREQATPAALRARLTSQIAAWRPIILKAAQFAD